MSEALVARPAASVILVREHDGTLEVFLIERGATDQVLANTMVFPGGKLEYADNSEQALELWDAPPASIAAQRMQESNEAMAQGLMVAAVRETFEEANIRLRASELHPFSRWITPVVPQMMQRRFDTRFLLAWCPVDQVARHDPAESASSRWISPAAALRAYGTGVFRMAPPQIMTLVELDRLGSATAVRAALVNRRVPVIQPEPFHVGDRRGVAYPGDALHPVKERAMPGPTRLVFREGRLEPEQGAEAFFVRAQDH
jgi:8-oxo-dGTP pyrophosphatase MutT (NUDIX family)